MFKQLKAIERNENRLKALESLCADLERKGRGLELEFVELYDKVRHQMSRMSKRHSAMDKANGGEVPVEEVPDELQNTDPVSRSILLKRGHYRR